MAKTSIEQFSRRDDLTLDDLENLLKQLKEARDRDNEDPFGPDFELMDRHRKIETAAFAAYGRTLYKQAKGG